MTSPRAYVFDAYGTLFDVHSAAARYKDEIGASWDRMSQLWRTKHLEYTWIHAQTDRHTRVWFHNGNATITQPSAASTTPLPRPAACPWACAASCSTPI